MARLSGAVIEKRENFMRGWMQKQKDGQKPVTLESANGALVSHFGKGTPKMRPERVISIRDEVLGVKTGTGKRGPGRPKGSKNKSKVASAAPVAPTSAKRGPGRPKGSKNKVSTRHAGATALTGGMFVLTGDVPDLLALAKMAHLSVQVDEAATQALAALRASA